MWNDDCILIMLQAPQGKRVERMRHHIEHAKIKYDRVTVTGWLVGDTLHSETQLWMEDGRGHRIPCEVERILPDYKERRKWLKENGTKLIARI